MTLSRNESQDTGAKSLSRRSLLAMGAAAPVLAVATPASAQSGVTVDPAAVRQTIQGFGGMNHTVWIPDLTAAQRDTAFGNDAGQLGFSILRIPVYEDSSRWSGEVATAQRAIELGAKVIASPWNPPSHMVENFSGGRRLRYDAYGAYAQHLNDFTAYLAGQGVDLYGISVQNEPDYAHDWTWWTASELTRFLRDHAGSLTTKVIAPESFQYRKNISDPILNDPAALANLDILGAHLYGTQPADFPYPLYQQRGQGKELWMTEVYYPNSSDSADLWPQALDVGEHIHRAMVDGQFQAYLWWYIRRYYGPMREDGQISKRGANMAHFSKFVRPGYVRVAATANPQSNVYTSAYKGTDGEIVIVAVNKNSWSANVPFTMRNTTASSVSRWLTDGSRNLQAQSDIGVSGGSFTAQLPARSITTFVTNEGGDGGGVQTGVFYRLVAQHSGKAADISSASTSAGARLIQWRIHSGSNQQFEFVASGGEYYRIRARHSGLVLQVASTASGADITQQPDTNATSQQWRPVQQTDGTFSFVNRQSGLAMDVWEVSTADGARISQWSVSGNANQRFTLQQV